MNKPHPKVAAEQPRQVLPYSTALLFLFFGGIASKSPQVNVVVAGLTLLDEPIVRWTSPRL